MPGNSTPSESAINLPVISSAQLRSEVHAVYLYTAQALMAGSLFPVIAYDGIEVLLCKQDGCCGCTDIIIYLVKI